MQGVVITSLGWERVLLTLHGLVDLASGGPGPGSFYLRLRDTEEQVPLPKVSFEGDRFEITINITQAIGRYPLPTGEWLLCWTDAEGIEQPTFMARPFPLDAADYGGLFLVRSGQYWMLPAADKLTSRFYINVNDRSQLPPEVVRRRRSFNAIKRDFRTTVFRAVYELTRRLVRKTGRRVLFASDSRAELSGNLKCIHDRMVERGLDSEYELMTAFKEAVIARRGLLDKFTFPITVAKADFIIIDDLHPMLYKVDYDEHVRIIQTWHASGSFKTFGYSRLGTQGAPAPFSKWHRNYTHAIASSTFDVPLYAEAFSMPDELVLPTGVPRMDLFLDPARQEAHREAVYEVYPQIRDKKIILFAPTFRGAVYRVAYYDFDLIDFDGLYQLAEEQDAVVIFKIHPLVRDSISIPEQYADRFFDATHNREINDFLLVADLVITDYSSLVFECAAINCPMLFFAYDLDEYIAERGFYTPFEEFVPGKIVRTFDELLAAIRADDFEAEKIAPFAKQHFDHLDAGSSDRVIDQLILGE
jgi:CDP-ribitol ribitolphosphotransferase / teichoic acid ribitol-phosphate polymerase